MSSKKPIGGADRKLGRGAGGGGGGGGRGGGGGFKFPIKNLRSCFKFIPRQIKTYVETDWSPRYAVNSGLLTKIKGFKMRDRGLIWPEHTCLQ